MGNKLHTNLIGNLLHSSLSIVKSSDVPDFDTNFKQEEQLKKLLLTARKTVFGLHHSFKNILENEDMIEAFQKNVPITEYDSFYQNWLRFSIRDQENICWPGLIPSYALSSGTSEATSKQIPVSKEMIADMKKATKRMFFDLTKYDMPPNQFTKQMLMIGSCTLPSVIGKHQTGDLSGIIGQNRPFWMEPYYRPQKNITDQPEWKERIEAIAQNAPKWDIGFIVSNPMWLQILFEKIMETHKLENIHEIWPNFRLLVHGGVFFEPYRAVLEQNLLYPVHYVDSYIASEGFFAYQNVPNKRDLQLQIDCGVFFEFIPFDDENFDDDGNYKQSAQAIPLKKVENGVQYAVVISTSAGLWRYMIGDTVIFTDATNLKFRLTGRTKQFLSACGEHLSLDNINEAVRRTDVKTGVRVREFTVAAEKQGNFWAHQWWFNLENPSVSNTEFMNILDENSKI
jgi:hypothetical protein